MANCHCEPVINRLEGENATIAVPSEANAYTAIHTLCAGQSPGAVPTSMAPIMINTTPTRSSAAILNDRSWRA